eukprot:479673_1
MELFPMDIFYIICALCYDYHFTTIIDNVVMLREWTNSTLLRLHDWIYCVCLVTVDANKERIVQFAYPFDILSHEEKTNIANLSFPDTHNVNTEFTSKFMFRFRARMMNENEIQMLDENRKLSYSHRHKSHAYLFGYVYFKQTADGSIDKCCFQKAVVIITPVPYIHVFLKAVEIIGSSYFEDKSRLKILDRACHNICSWPLPNIGGDVTLPLLSNIINVVLQPKSVAPSAGILINNKNNNNDTKEEYKQEN